MNKKNLLTYQGLQKLEDELQNLKVVKRKEYFLSAFSTNSGLLISERTIPLLLQ